MSDRIDMNIPTQRNISMNIVNSEGGIGMNINTSGGGTKDHSKLKNLDYEHSGHTGFQKAGNYKTKEENDLLYQEKGDYLTEIPSEYKTKEENDELYQPKGDYALESDIPIKLSQLQNDTSFITNAANNLINYYLKSETYSKDEINNLIGQISTVSIQVVQQLPQTGETNVIYFVPRNIPNTDDIYNEYIYVNNNWELIGNTQIDLTGYATENWVNLQIADFLTETEIINLINANLNIKTYKINYTEAPAIYKSYFEQWLDDYNNGKEIFVFVKYNIITSTNPSYLFGVINVEKYQTNPNNGKITLYTTAYGDIVNDDTPGYGVETGYLKLYRRTAHIVNNVVDSVDGWVIIDSIGIIKNGRTKLLAIDNTKEYTPTPDSYNPATTKYVDSVINGLSTVATTGDYSDLLNKPNSFLIRSNYTLSSGSNLNTLPAGIYEIKNVAHNDFPISGSMFGVLIQYSGEYKPQMFVAGGAGECSMYYRRWLTSSNSFTPWTMANDVVWATYGTTTYEEITNWISQNKLVLCNYNGDIYRYAYDDNNRHYFYGYFSGNTFYSIYVGNNNTWSYVNSTFQNAYYRINSDSTTVESDTTYYSALAVKNRYVAKTSIATSFSSSSTNDEVAGAKAVYDAIGDIESLLYTLNSGGGAS